MLRCGSNWLEEIQVFLLYAASYSSGTDWPKTNPRKLRRRYEKEFGGQLSARRRRLFEKFARNSLPSLLLNKENADENQTPRISIEEKRLGKLPPQRCLAPLQLSRTTSAQSCLSSPGSDIAQLGAKEMHILINCKDGTNRATTPVPTSKVQLLPVTDAQVSATLAARQVVDCQDSSMPTVSPGSFYSHVKGSANDSPEPQQTRRFRGTTATRLELFGEDDSTDDGSDAESSQLRLLFNQC